MGTGICAGKRKPPCGRGSNCKGFEKGYRCGAHAPAKGCAGHGTTEKQNTIRLSKEAIEALSRPWWDQ